MAEEATAEAVEAEATEATEEQEQEQVETKQDTGEEMVSKSDVERIVKDRLARERRKWAKEQKQKMAEAEPKSQEPATDAVEDRLSEMMARIEERAAALEAKEIEADYRTAVGGVSVDESRAKYLRWAFEHDREAFDAEVKALRAPDLPPEKKGPGFNSPGAPNGVAPGTISDDPRTWSADVIAQKRKDGTFLNDMNKWRDSLPGGGGGLFPAKTPGKK